VHAVHALRGLRPGGARRYDPQAERDRGGAVGPDEQADKRSRHAQTVWLFDLDNTLHDAGAYVFGALNVSMGAYVAQAVGVDAQQADALRRHYWQRYGATLLGLIRHHGVKPAHFLRETHHLPGLEASLSAHAHDTAALRRLPGRKVIVTNAPQAYARRVLGGLGLLGLFDDLIAIEHMTMFGHLRPKPDARMLRALAVRLKVAPGRCVLVEDTLAHQKAAHRVGMATVWMQRWLRANQHGPEVGVYLRRKPPYVSARIRCLQALQRVRPRAGV
jgi:putative hydrolase of the HAD superfamily